MKSKKSTKLQAPWFDHYNKIRVLFSGDPDINVELNKEETKVTISCSDPIKLSILKNILKTEPFKGHLELEFVCDGEFKSNSDYVGALFANNSHFKEMIVEDTPLGEHSFIVFKKEVLQYFNDDISDPHGMNSVLAEDIARDVLHLGIFATTSILY